jgi:diaminopimelate decarboxylase
MLPADVQVGDRLLFRNVGAYSLVLASPFNGFPAPDVLVV